MYKRNFHQYYCEVVGRFTTLELFLSSTNVTVIIYNEYQAIPNQIALILVANTPIKYYLRSSGPLITKNRFVKADE